MVSVIVRPVAPHIDAAGTADQAVAVIAHPRVPVADLKLSELRRLFLGERQFWSQDLPVVLLVPAQGLSEREILLSRVLNKTENEYRAHWIAKIFRNEAAFAPKVTPSSDVTLDLVSRVPGALALVNASSIPARVKMITVDGKHSGDAAYALR